MFQKLVTDDGILVVTDVSVKEDRKSRPSGLNTVNLLKACTLCSLCHFCSCHLFGSLCHFCNSVTWSFWMLFLHISQGRGISYLINWPSFVVEETDRKYDENQRRRRKTLFFFRRVAA